MIVTDHDKCHTFHYQCTHTHVQLLYIAICGHVHHGQLWMPLHACTDV